MPIPLYNKYKTIITNTGALTFLQASNYIIPLLVLPFLARTLGPEMYGLFLFSQVLNGYFLIINEYGFNFIGTRQIALARNRVSKISQIFSSIMIAKFFLLVLCLLILTFVAFSFDRFSSHKLVYFYSFGVVIGNFLFPVWLYQGFEKMKTIVIITFLSRLSYIILVLTFVRNPDDYILAALFNSVSYIIAGIIAFTLSFQIFKVQFYIPSKSRILQQLNSAWPIFSTNFSISLYALSNTFLLGIVTNNTVVGYYASMEKIIQAVKFIFNPFFQAIYPAVMRKAVEDPHILKGKMIKLVSIMIILSVCVWATTYFLSENIIELLLGADYLEGLNVFKVLSVLIITTPISFLIFNILFISFRMERLNFKIYFSSAMVNLILVFSFLMIFDLGPIGAALANVITQILILIFGIYFAKKRIFT